MAFNKNQNTAMEAITYHQENGEINQDGAEIQQPRQPVNLPGLMRFAMEATKAEDAPQESHHGPMDEERKKFLDAAIKSMTVNVIEVLNKQIEILQGIPTLKATDDIEPYTTALETILEYIDNLDTANDFHKIGGFTILQPCLKCSNPEIRAGACDVLAELCQNNPYCQRMVLNDNFIPLLLRTLGSEADINVCGKVLYAVSCIVRHNTDAFQQMLQYEGLHILLKILQKGIDKLTIKTTFLLSSLCNTQPDLISRLVFMEYIPVLLALLARERTPCYEHVLSLLLLLAEENCTVVNECKKPEHNLEEILKNNLRLTAHKEEFQEEEAYCNRLLNMLFK